MATTTTDIFEELGKLDPTCQSKRAQSLLAAAAVDLMALVHKPSRERLEKFLEAARGALRRLPPINPAVAGELTAFLVGQTAMLVECAQWATLQKVPNQAVETLRQSPAKRAMLAVLVRHGKTGAMDLAKHLGKRHGNLRKMRDELVDAGLMTREALGRNVYLSATPIGAAALDQLEKETVDALPPSLQASESPDVTHGPHAPRPRPVPLAAARPIPDPVPSSSDWRLAVREYVKVQRDGVRLQPVEARPRAAAAAAHTFRQKFPAVPPLRWAKGKPALHESLASKVVACDSYVLSDSELCLVASDPGMYLPAVLEPLDDGTLGLNVGSYLDGGLDLIRAHVDHGDKWLWLALSTERWRRYEAQLAPVPTRDFVPDDAELIPA